MALLQSGWMEALVLAVVWRSLSNNGSGGDGEEIVFAANLRLGAEQCRRAGLADLYSALRHLTTKYQQMNLTQEEPPCCPPSVESQARWRKMLPGPRS